MRQKREGTMQCIHEVGLANPCEKCEPPTLRESVERLHAEVKARIANNEKTAAVHLDLGVRIAAQARVEAYRLVGKELERILSQKEPDTNVLPDELVAMRRAVGII